MLGHGRLSLRMKARELLGGTWVCGSSCWNLNRSWLRVVTPFGEIPSKLDQSEIYLAGGVWNGGLLMGSERIPKENIALEPWSQEYWLYYHVKV